MTNGTRLEELTRRLRRGPWISLALALGVLLVTIVLTTFQVRGRIRGQITQRDAGVLQAVLVLQMDALAAELATPAPTDPADQMRVVLTASRLRGVLGIRLLDADGRFLEALPPALREEDLSADVVARARRLQPVSRFFAKVAPAEVFYPSRREELDERPLPMLVLTLPLHTSANPRLLGIAQFLLEGHTLSDEFRRLDRHLLMQSVCVFAVTGLVLVAGSLWAFRRLRHAHRLLAERTSDLVAANQELALAARTTALGAVTSHLIHGLKSPLAGLRSFVERQAEAPAGESDSGWKEAADATRRMQALIQEVVNVLQEEQVGSRYRVPAGDLVEMVERRVLPLAQGRGVGWEAHASTRAHLGNRTANLTVLILVNLAENAIQATAPGGRVSLSIQDDQRRLRVQVEDQGGGFAGAPPDTVFRTRRSTKEGGSGIGLAISKQLANHLGASLELVRSSEKGSCLELCLPLDDKDSDAAR